MRRVAIVRWAIPLRTPLATARGPIAERRGFLVALEADGGLRGVGEASPHPAAPPAALAATSAALEAATGWLHGASLSALAVLLARLEGMDRAAAAGIDVALHDLAARAAGRRLADVLVPGAARDGTLRPGAARDGVLASAMLEGGTPDACAAAAASAVAAGFAAAKLKVGPDVATAVARVAAARGAAPGLRLRADANGCWDGDAAVRAAVALGRYDLEWLEQPVAADDVAGMARVRREAGIPVAADESVTGAAAVARLAGVDAADVVVLKLVQVGGLAPALAAARAARDAGLAVTVTTAIDTGIGTAAALHLAAALPGPLRDCGLATSSLLAGDLLGGSIPAAPVMRLPAGAGLGVAPAPVSLARWGDA